MRQESLEGFSDNIGRLVRDWLVRDWRGERGEVGLSMWLWVELLLGEASAEVGMAGMAMLILDACLE